CTWSGPMGRLESPCQVSGSPPKSGKMTNYLLVAPGDNVLPPWRDDDDLWVRPESISRTPRKRFTPVARLEGIARFCRPVGDVRRKTPPALPTWSRGRHSGWPGGES